MTGMAVILRQAKAMWKELPLLGTPVASIWGGGCGVLAMWHRRVGLGQPWVPLELQLCLMGDSWLGLSILHGLAGVTDGVTDTWDRHVALPGSTRTLMTWSL